MADIKPTRSELIKLKKNIKLAKSGWKLLKKKRDGLILDFFEILKKAKSLRSELTQEYVKARETINIARAVEGDTRILSLAQSITASPEVEVKTKNIMGVVVPKIETTHTTRKFSERGYGVHSGSLMLDEAISGFERLVAKIIQAAEIETSMKKLLYEIEKTKRRVNALEFAVIPKMEEQANFIRLRLEEQERDNLFSLKHIKQKTSSH